VRHRNTVDLRCLAHHHRRAVLGFQNGVEQASDALHISINRVVIEPKGGEVETGVAGRE
jgi:hypothetical protein